MNYKIISEKHHLKKPSSVKYFLNSGIYAPVEIFEKNKINYEIKYEKVAIHLEQLIKNNNHKWAKRLLFSIWGGNYRRNFELKEIIQLLNNNNNNDDKTKKLIKELENSFIFKQNLG